MSTTLSSDIVELIKKDHRQIEQLFGVIDAAGPLEQEGLFWTLLPELVRHEVAEELVVYPRIRSDAPNGDSEADARIKEQSEAEEQLVAMERLDPTRPEFAAQMKQLKTAVQAHAKAEEECILPLLSALENEEDRMDLGARYEKAKASAPTRPHPHAPHTPPGDKLLGPIEALIDKTRNAVRNNI